MEKEELFLPNKIKVNNKDSKEEVTSMDFIPTGTFYAEGNDELTKERILAIQLVEEIGNQLALEHPEVAEIYKDPTLRLIDIAKHILPQDYVNQYPEVCSKAVGWAIRHLNPADEQANLTRQHRRHSAELNFDFSNPDFITQCKEAAKKRHELHGVDTEAMIRGRGREPWSLAEKALLNDLVINSDFQHQAGSIKGTPNYEKIAKELNRLFYNAKEVRTTNSVGSLVRDSRRKKQ